VSRYEGGVPIAEVVRSDFVESQHLGSYAALDADGSLVASAGDPHGAILPRSSNKPMQAVAMLRCGLRPSDQADLALVAASHWGEPFHIERVRALLAAASLDESALACPPDLPLGPDARAEVLRAGGVPSRVYMNCSGKHAGMLATCVAAGWTHQSYERREHPLQEACRRAVSEMAGEPVAGVGVDGCGAPVFAIPLVGLARAFLAAVSADPDTPERSVADAMRAYPEMMSGTGADDARLMRAVPGLLAKGGAEGVLAVAVPDVGAVAIKVDDGAARATLPVLVAALGRLGLSSPALDEAADVAVLGGGDRGGTVRAIVK
jgi:L-asparaginase II